MEPSGFALHDSNYSQKCVSCGTLVCCETLQDLQKMFITADGRPAKTCKRCRDNREGKSPFEQRDVVLLTLTSSSRTTMNLLRLSRPLWSNVMVIPLILMPTLLRFRATLAGCFVLENDVSMASCAQSNDENLHKRAIKCFRNDLFDCTGYYFHLRRRNERVDGPRFSLTCSRSNERRTGERDLQAFSGIQVCNRSFTFSTFANPTSGAAAKEFFDCHGELHISFSKSNRSATIIYDHKCHAETPKFRITEEIQQYIKAQKLFPPRQIYQNLVQLADSPQFAKTDLHTITRQQVYNVWLSLTEREWERDRADDFKSAQLLVGEHIGFQLIEGLQEPGVSLAFTTPCFTDRANYNRAKMTEIFIDSTFGTNRHGYELSCVLTEYDLVSLPLFYLLLDTRSVQEVGKRGSRLTTWLMALRDAGLKS
ncbi:hypothetical protein V1505DRAFT_35291 [Lipomyces doorenjongii]